MRIRIHDTPYITICIVVAWLVFVAFKRYPGACHSFYGIRLMKIFAQFIARSWGGDKEIPSWQRGRGHNEIESSRECDNEIDLHT